METNTKPMTVEALQAVTAQIAQLHQQMKYLTALTPEQRDERKRKLRPKDLHLLPNRVEAARQNRKLLPPTLDLPKLEEDAALTEALAALLSMMDKVYADVHDTFLVVSHVATVSAASANHYIKVASITAQRLNPTERPRRSRTSGQTVATVTQAIPNPNGLVNGADVAMKQAA